MSKSFPLFISLENKDILVVGAGKIAKRRINTLNEFGCNITVIADIIDDEIYSMSNINFVKRKYMAGDCNNFFMVLALTNNKKVNRKILHECNKNNILVNICDDKEKCDFYFPAIISQDNIVIGVTASGENHSLVKQISDRIRNIKNELFKLD